MKNRTIRLILLISSSCWWASGQTTPLSPGQTRTLLPDGRWLVTGGTGLAGPQSELTVREADADNAIRWSGALARPRAWHTATVLPKGTVFILGGADANGVVETAEVFDPVTLRIQPPPVPVPTPRAYHTATLLTDGRLLIAGGVSTSGTLLQEAELWDPQTGLVTTLPLKLSVPRRNHTATLLADGRVLLWGGLGPSGAILQNGDLYDPESQSFTPVEVPPVPDDSGNPGLAASLPTDNAIGVPVGSFVAVRFSRALRVATVSPVTVTLDDSRTPVTAKVVAAEGGMLAFLTPQAPLLPATTYTVSIDGPSDAADRRIAPVKFIFTTASDSSSNGTKNPQTSKQLPVNTNEPDNLPPLRAPRGTTALSGRVLASETARALPGIALELTCGKESKTTRSDATGRFLISTATAGHCELEIDGGRVRGLYFAGVDLKTGQTNVLPYLIWLTEIDNAHAVNIPSPVREEFVVSSPLVPGLEVRLPPGAVITDYDGNVVRQLSITRVPVGRPPFALPTSGGVSFYFTVQPGGAYIQVPATSAGPKGARLIYPNVGHAPAGTRLDFWNYDPDQKGWYMYGQGTVSRDQRSVVPDPGVVVYKFTGAMVEGPGGSPPQGPGPPCNVLSRLWCLGGDPVDLGTGLFTLEKTDLYLPGVMPIALKRTYRQADNMSRAFGIGSNHNLDVFLVGDVNPYTYLDLILADGGRVHYPRTSSGTGWTDAVYEHTASQTRFYKSKINWNGNGWTLTFKDGSVWYFPESANKTIPTQSAVIGMVDRNGNGLGFSRDPSSGRLYRVTSSSGRWINFTFDAASRITQAQDNSGRTTSYVYDVEGRLATVTDANGGVTKYSYDPNNQLIAITDPRNITYLANYYDASGRVIQQDLADGGSYQFAYTLDISGNIIQTDVSNPRGYVSRSTFDTTGYYSGGKVLSHTEALGTSIQQTTAFTYQTGTGLRATSTDPLSRQTSYSYDSCGNMTGITRLAGTSSAVATTMTYQTAVSGTPYPCVAVFNQLTSVTDPLSHTTSFGYDSHGNLTSVTDPLSHTLTITRNTDGQPASVTDAAGTTQFAYTGGDLVAVTDPTSNTSRWTLDSAGRLVSQQAPLGQTSRYQYDPANQLLQLTDALNGQTAFTYDGNGNLLTLTDARNNTTTYSPNSMDRVASRTDALSHSDGYQYDLNGNPTQFTDRKGQATSASYDELDRLHQLTFADSSTITYTYDAGNRVTQVVDSISGTITRSYDNINRLTSETTPQGTVNYTYDNAGRRATMTVAGQSAVSYTYDNADRLTQIAQGTATVSIGYDNANRRTSLTLPNGVIATYGYDAASRAISITYTNGSTTVGTLTYGYDANGRRVQMGGSLAQVNLPATLSSATYNADNQLTQWGSATLTYDLNGSMTSDGTTTHTWNARTQLSAFGSTSFAYDALGRRTQNAAGTKLLYDGVNAVQELSGSTVTANLLTGLGVDEVFTRTDSGGTKSYLEDVLGSTVALTDSSGAVLTQYSYEPFGKTTATGTSSSNTYQFTGRENDGTGLYYYRARYYNPTLSRFISQDPSGFAGSGINLYSYTGDDPIGFVDPFGRARKDPLDPPIPFPPHAPQEPPAWGDYAACWVSYMIGYVGQNKWLIYGSGVGTIAGWGGSGTWGSSWGPGAGVVGIIIGGVGLNIGAMQAAKYCSALTGYKPGILQPLGE